MYMYIGSWIVLANVKYKFISTHKDVSRQASTLQRQIAQLGESDWSPTCSQPMQCVEKPYLCYWVSPDARKHIKLTKGVHTLKTAA